MSYVYCKSHLRIHWTDEEGSTGGICGVVDKGDMPRTHEDLGTDEPGLAYERVVDNGWPLFPDVNMDKTWDISGTLRERK